MSEQERGVLMQAIPALVFALVAVVMIVIGAVKQLFHK